MHARARRLRQLDRMTLDLGLASFETLEGAESAFADARDGTSGSWLDEVALVEHHRGDRLVVRGTVAGHYVDSAEDGDVIGPSTAAGAFTGSLSGGVFGPSGFAVGLVTGASLGGMVRSKEADKLDAELVSEIRGAISEGESGLVLLAERGHVDAMFAALRGSGARVAIRRSLSEDEMATLEAALAEAPPAARHGD